MDAAQLKALMAKFPVKELDTGNLRTCPVRLSYPNLFEKSKGEDGYQAKYGATLLFPKGAVIDKLREAARQVAIDHFGAKAGSMGLKMPFRDQAEKEGKTGYVPGAFFFRANSDQQPGIVVPGGKIPKPTDFYAGCWVLATVRPFAFQNKQRGVAFGLQNIAKIADDESFGGTPADANEEFGDVLEGAGAFAADAFGDSKGDSFSHDFG